MDLSEKRMEFDPKLSTYSQIRSSKIAQIFENFEPSDVQIGNRMSQFVLTLFKDASKTLLKSNFKPLEDFPYLVDIVQNSSHLPAKMENSESESEFDPSRADFELLDYFYFLKLTLEIAL